MCVYIYIYIHLNSWWSNGEKRSLRRLLFLWLIRKVFVHRLVCVRVNARHWGWSTEGERCNCAHWGFVIQLRLHTEETFLKINGLNASGEAHTGCPVHTVLIIATEHTWPLNTRTMPSTKQELKIQCYFHLFIYF